MRMEVYTGDRLAVEKRINKWYWNEDVGVFCYRPIGDSRFSTYESYLFHEAITAIKITDGELEYYAYRDSDEELLKFKIKTFYQIVRGK